MGYKVLGTEWHSTFLKTIQHFDMAGSLKDAAQKGSLAKWTECITEAVIRTCRASGWQPVAKGCHGSFMPQQQQEYLGIDVMAFDEKNDKPWKFPVAVFELENSKEDNRVAYSLWKVLCIRSKLKVVICYRKNAEDGIKLVRSLKKNVIESLGIAGRTDTGGETMIVVGSRDETDTFPYGFFKEWYLDLNTGNFIRQ
jgi:hypothetical protein